MQGLLAACSPTACPPTGRTRFCFWRLAETTIIIGSTFRSAISIASTIPDGLCFQTEKEQGLNGRALNYPRGKVLGGCSSINGMIYMRGQARDYDQWRQMGNPGWGWDDVLPLFRKSEDFHKGGDDMHGAGGEWRVETARVRWAVLDAFQQAAEEAGIPKTPDFNRGTNEGSGYFDVNQRSGIRWNTVKAFLRPAMKRGNLRVVTKAQAKKLIIEQGEVKGVEVSVGGVDQRFYARRETVLSAGAIGSPHLLELSGVGRERFCKMLESTLSRKSGRWAKTFRTICNYA